MYKNIVILSISVYHVINKISELKNGGQCLLLPRVTQPTTRFYLNFSTPLKLYICKKNNRTRHL